MMPEMNAPAIERLVYDALYGEWGDDDARHAARLVAHAWLKQALTDAGLLKTAVHQGSDLTGGHS